MFELIIVFFLGTLALGLCIERVAKGKGGAAWGWGIAAVASFGFATFLVGPVVLGFGKVPDTVEEIKVRLQGGVAYQVVSSLKVEGGGGSVLLVKKIGTPYLYALRVKEADRPPEHFTLIDGKPVAIATPASQSAKNKKK